MMSSGWTAASPAIPRAGSAVHSMVTAPEVNPAPKATMTMWSPTLTRPLVDRLGQGDRHGRRGRVAVLVEVDEHAVHRQVQALGDGLDDPDVGLVRDEQVDVGRLEAGALDGRQRGRRQRPGREPVGLLALHPDEVLAAGDGLGRRRALGPAGRQPDHVRALRLGRHLDAEAAAGLVRGGQHDRAGPVAEQDAGVPVGVVEEPGQQLGADDQDVPGHAAGDVRLRGGIGVDEAGAGRGHVHRRRARVADGLLDQRRRRGHPVVGRQGGEEDEVDLVGVDAGRPDRPQRGDRRHRRGRLVGGRDASLADPRPRHDPLVGRVDHLLEVVVGEDLRRRVAAPAGHMGMTHGRAHSGSTSISGCFALTRAPLSGTTRTTRPARSDLISLNSFIASIRPITWPTATSPPTWT